MGLFSSIFGTYSDRQIRKIEPTVRKIEALAPVYSKMSDEGLFETTQILKDRLAAGETLDDILPDAFALVREAADRVLGKRPFRVQLMGGILLHQGRIAEMKTGEGKTLVATLPAYLNALTGEGVHIVTVNEYLARLGYEEMGRIYSFLGLTTGLIYHGMSREEKQAAYRADITYGTNNEFGFDYLRDNMVVYAEHTAQRAHAFAIVDEVDSILIDEARTPLIISGEGEKSTELYDRTEQLVSRMRVHRIKEMDTKVLPDDIDADYVVDEKARTTVLTARGTRKVEEFFRIENFSDPENSTIAHHVYQALKAHGIMHLDEDYVVKDDQVLIVDTFTGRIMPGRRYSDGLHQAIEAKEHVKIEKENKTLATITFQNYFRLYKKLSGMTGTALTEEMEFREIYNLDVVVVPTNEPMIRVDHNDMVYPTKEGKYESIIQKIKECHEKGQPVLVGTVSVEKSEELSRRLRTAGITHSVLNAKYHEKEAEIVAQAGRLGTVTISTNMAGRGTDIMLGGNAEFMAKQEMRRREYDEEMIGHAVSCAPTDDPDILAARGVYRELYRSFCEKIRPEADLVRAAGGLFIIGTERHESRRIDNQLRGRAGRQGDPGESQFYLSLEDDLLRLFGSDRVMGMISRLGLPYNQPISATILSGTIESAQKRLESNNFNRRKHVLSYDDVMNQQREIIYGQRREVLDGADLKDKIADMLARVIDNKIAETAVADLPSDAWSWDELRNYFTGTLCYPDDFTAPENTPKTQEELGELLHGRAASLYAEKERVMTEEVMREAERRLLLRNIDLLWMDHLDDMEDLKQAIGLQAYAQRNPVSEYRIQGAQLFDAMCASIQENTIRQLLTVAPVAVQEKRAEVAKVTGEGFEGAPKPKKRPAPKRAAPKVGPNDPCPCGSGKKYKKCCGAPDSQ